jgi:hypothetical protein
MDASKEAGLEVNTEKTIHCCLVTRMRFCLLKQQNFKEHSICIRLFQMKKKCVIETYNRLNLYFRKKKNN